MSQNQGRTSGSGLDSNLAGALSYLLGALTGVAFLIIDKDDRFVRFHAMQSILFTVALLALGIALGIVTAVLGAVPFLGWLFAGLLSLVFGVGSFLLWLVLMYRAYQGSEWELPFLGEHARRLTTQPGA